MDKKRMEELMARRVAPVPDRQVVKSVDLLEPPTTKQDHNELPREEESTNISTAKTLSIQETMDEDSGAGKKRGRPRSATEGLVHFSTWLPEELTWEIRARAVALHKKDYEVVTEAIKAYLQERT